MSNYSWKNIWALLLLVSLLAGILGFVIAGEAVSVPKQRSLSELIQFTITKGVEHPVRAVTAKQFGFNTQMPAKSLWFGKNQTKDRYEHYFDVIYVSSGDHIEPINLLWMKFQKTTVYDQSLFLSTTKGLLLRTMRGGGTPGHVWQREVKIDRKVEEDFQREKQFFLSDSIGLKPNE